MDRKEFLRKSLGLITIVPLVNQAKESLAVVKGGSGTDCNLTSSETAGPFPMKGTMYSGMVSPMRWPWLPATPGRVMPCPIPLW